MAVIPRQVWATNTVGDKTTTLTINLNDNGNVTTAGRHDRYPLGWTLNQPVQLSRHHVGFAALFIDGQNAGGEWGDHC